MRSPTYTLVPVLIKVVSGNHRIWAIDHIQHELESCGASVDIRVLAAE